MQGHASLIAAAAIAALSGCSPVEPLPPLKSPINWRPEGYGCVFVAPPYPIVVERPANPADCLAMPGAPKRLHMLVRVRGALGVVERVSGSCSPEPYAIDAGVLKCIQNAVRTWSYVPFSSCDPTWASPESLLLAAPKRAGEHGTVAHEDGLPECREAGI
jgi:hypothetical protein